MNKRTKTGLALLLALVLALGLCPAPAAAADTDTAEARIVAALEARGEEVDLAGLGLTVEGAQDLIARVLDDPAWFYCVADTVWYDIDNGAVTGATLFYDETLGDGALAAFASAADAALESVLPGMDDLQMALALHDYLAVHVAYDSENAMAGTIPPASYTAYGALVLGVAVCEGYSQAYRYLLDRCGIPNRLVGSDPMNHAWCLVELEGSWYHVDVTFDDPTPDVPGGARHNNFLLSDAAIADAEHGHTGWSADVVCTDTRYDSDAGALWRCVNTPLIFTDLNTLWLLRETGDGPEQLLQLVRRDWSEGTETVVAEAADYWPVWGQTDAWYLDSYAGFCRWDGRLFFSDSLRVYAYDPADGSLELLGAYVGDAGYLYGLAAGDGGLELTIRQDPYAAGTVLALPLERKYPAPEPDPTPEPDPVPDVTAIFTDVSEGDYFLDAVRWAFVNGVTKGTGETTFSPLNACTRGQVVTFLWRAMGCPEAPDGAGFADVAADAYYAGAVRWAVATGVTNGTGADPATGLPLFDPDAPCSYAHILTFLWRTVTGKAVSGYGSWYSEPMVWAGSLGLTADTPLAPGAAGAAAVDDDCPRCDVVVFLFRAVGA